MRRFLLPLGIFIVLVGFLAVGLRLKPREIPSPFIGKPAPAFRIAQLHAPDRTIGPEDLRGEVWLLNIWASWCVSCREEHPVLVELAKSKLVTMVGLDYKDEREKALSWLARNGDPYLLSAYDGDGRVGMDFGVYGVPETFIVDKTGIVRYKQIGPLTEAIVKEKIIPLVKVLNGT
jgi:cytochrome c biogenesis protein CcmG, thiol:disulfide interchange protein DsbE